MGRTVLIVDDEISIHSALDFYLKQHDIKVLHAVNGKEAIQVMKTTRPDLILMDFKLDGPNGVIVTRKIRSIPDFKDIPIIGITAFASQENKKIAQESGMISVIEKPFDLVELQKIFNTFIL